MFPRHTVMIILEVTLIHDRVSKQSSEPMTLIFNGNFRKFILQEVFMDGVTEGKDHRSGEEQEDLTLSSLPGPV